MIEIAIIKVENPSCLWGRIVKAPGIEADSSKEYDNLQVKMNLFYHMVNQDVHKLKLSSIEEGQVCVVYFSAMKSWCRAMVESLFLGTAGSQAMCFLVDHGERVIVSSDEIRAPLKKFLLLPFWVRKFHLAGISPTRLQVSICDEKAELIPALQWDSSATRFLHNLLQASTQMEAMLRDSQPDSTAIELYLTIKNVKICVNDDLVNKKFAYFSSEKTLSSGQTGVVDCTPAILACDIFTDTDIFLATDGCAMRPLSRSVSSPKTPVAAVEGVAAKGRILELGQGDSEASSDVSRKDQENDKKGDGGKATLRHGNKSRTEKRPQRNPGASDPSDTPEDADTSLVSALYKNLNLFRFLRFLNPASSGHAVLNGEQDDDFKQVFVVTQEEAASGTPHDPPGEPTLCNGESKHGQVDSEPVQHLEPSCPVDPGGNTVHAQEYSCTTMEEAFACSRLLQLLNPDPLNPDVDSSDVPVVYTHPSRSGVVVHSSLPLEPCTSLACAPISDVYRRILTRKKYPGPSVAESYCWPAVARGCDTLLISQSADQPLSYMPPFLAHMQLSSVFSGLSSRTGPIAVIICPSWEKAQTVFDLLEESQVGQSLHPLVVLVGQCKDEVKAVKIPNNCQLVVTTPFTLVRLLSFHCFLFLRLCHLVLDRVDLLFAQANDEMTTVLQHFQKVTSSEDRASCPRQIIAVAQRWSSHMEGLLTDHMNHPCLIITVMGEAALYGNVHQLILLCLDCTKITVLLGALDFHPDVAQKTLIIANSAEEVEHVYKAVSNTSAFSLKVHEGLTYQFDFVVEQWKKDIGPGTQVILVTTNDCMKALGIRDATCVVHYGFPSTPKVFGSRLFCMSENFRNLSDTEHSEKASSRCSKSVLLLSERNARHVIGVLRYLRRTQASLPPELLHFAQGVLQAKEEQKMDQPLCFYLKSFGFCKDSSMCSDRHTFSPEQDQSSLPDSGTIVVLPLYIRTASVYSGRIVRKQDDPYELLAAKMECHYATEKLCATEVVRGGLYGLMEEEVFHRVRLTSVPDRGERLFWSVTALFVDEGREQEVKAHQLLQLPTQFHTLPPQAVEIVLCRVKPIDAELDWNPKVTRVLSQKIKGLHHQAKLVLSLGNTVFVDPMVRMIRLPGLKTFINEYNIHSEILNTGMGTSNPSHLDLLKEFCQGTMPSSAGGNPLDAGLVGSEVSLEEKVQAAERLLAHRMRAAVESLHCGLELSAASTPAPSSAHVAAPAQCLNELSDPPPLQVQAAAASHAEHPVLVPAVPEPLVVATPEAFPESQPTIPHRSLYTVQSSSLIATLKNTAQCLRSLNGIPTGHGMTAVHTPCENGIHADERPNNDEQCVASDNTITIEKAKKMDSLKGFHPQIKWFQREDKVILNIKLTSPVSQTCLFFPGRVVYSGSVNNRPYVADLELHSTIASDVCTWEMKCNEPVLTLIKKHRQDWKMLLKQKSNFVSYDFDRFDEEEERTSNGPCFMAHTGEEGCYVNSDSDSESD